MRTAFALFSRISSAYLFVLTGYRLGCSHTISSGLVVCGAMYYQYWYYHGSTVAQYKLYSSTGTGTGWSTCTVPVLVDYWYCIAYYMAYIIFRSHRVTMARSHCICSGKSPRIAVLKFWQFSLISSVTVLKS